MTYLSSFGAGWLTGCIMSLMLGTVFFAILNNSIRLGYKKGISISIGVILSDIIYISVCLFGSHYIPVFKEYEFWVKIIGGLLVIVMGIFQIINKSEPAKIESYSKAGSITFFVSQGFILNFFNPVNLLSWFAIYTYLVTVLNYTFIQLIIYFIGSLCAIFFMESLLSYYSEKLNKYLPEKRVRQINMAVGILFVGLGIFIIFR
jgi:L-lysine exporter family protein LysE/ArgO